MRAIAALNLLNAHDMELLWRERGTVPERGAERLLRVKEAAKKFGVTADWLYRHHTEFGFTVRHGQATAVFGTRNRAAHPKAT